MLKVLLVMGLAVACQGYDDDYWKACFDGGTYKYGPNSTVPCICHVSFSNPFCSRQEKECSDSQCNNGRCVFVHGSYECECKEGFWGRLCEHTDAEVAHLNATTEADLALKHCRGEKDCPIEPPHLKVVCSNEDLDLCDEEGNVRPFKKCPYPWYCYEAFRNGKCDWECERSECLYDGYECSSNRVCSATCLTRSGACDMECEMQQEYFKNKTNANPSLATGTIIEFTLGVSEQFWWENKNEIIANISEPLRTPLIYRPEHNDVLEKNKNFKIRSRRRRSISNTVNVLLELLSKFCPNEASCAKSASTASQQVSVDAKKDGSGVWFVEGMGSPSNPKSFGNGTLAVCLVFIAVPILLIGYRVVSAPVWHPPKSEDEVPVVWTTPVIPNYERITTPLHEEAYSLSKIRLPIYPEYINGMDQQGRTPLFWLIASKKSSQLMLEDVDELVRAGAYPNHSDDKGETPLSIAITAVRPSICVRLVQWGADPAATTHSGASCLHLAVAQDDVQCVQWLLSFPQVKNNINEVDESDRTPLAMAAQGGMESARIAEILIAAGADVLHQGNHYTMWRYRGRTALHWAALFNNLEVMKVLLEHRSDVNCVDTEGCAPLHLAVQRGSEAAVRMLLEAHASTEIPNGLGFIPLSLAKKTGIQSLIELLTWYTDVRKEGLVMKKKERKKREKRVSDSGSDYSKRSCSSDSPFCDSLSNNSGSLSSGYFFPAMSSDSSSVGSGSSLTSSTSGSTHNASSYWSPICSLPSSSVQPKKARPCVLPPIQEKPVEFSLDSPPFSLDSPRSLFSLDSPRSESYIPQGGWATGAAKRESGSAESGLGPDYPLDSLLLSPYSEICSNGSGGPESPVEHLGTEGYWTDQEKSVDGFNSEEILQEFFVNWQH